MMKKAGYKPEFAGAAEAAASTGGQIMPPIMGAAAFLMADYVQLPYGQIALKAVLPALLYFTGIYISVHLEAKKVGLKGLPKEELPKLKPLLNKQLSAAASGFADLPGQHQPEEHPVRRRPFHRGLHRRHHSGQPGETRNRPPPCAFWRLWPPEARVPSLWLPPAALPESLLEPLP